MSIVSHVVGGREVTTQAIGSLGRLQKEEDGGEERGSETEANEPQGDYSV